MWFKKTRGSGPKSSAKKIAKAFGGRFLIAPAPGRNIDLMLHDEQLASTRPCIVSYGTRDGVYDVAAKRLEETCSRLGLDRSIETIPPCGRSNACLFKPSFIKFKLITLNRPIVWMDSDAILTEGVELPETDWDVATLDNNRKDRLNPKAALCVAFRPTVAALRFIETWESFCSAFYVAPGLDHARLNYTREVMAGHFVEEDLAPYLAGKLVRDAGRKKEFSF